MKCTVHCLNNCQGIIEQEGIGQAQVCFGNCNQVCVIGCALTGEPSLKAFDIGWSSATFFKDQPEFKKMVTSQQSLISTDLDVVVVPKQERGDSVSLPTFE